MKWSAPLVTESIGTRLTAVQFTPSGELENTMSFEVQFLRKRQSCHAVYTLPAPSISAVGRGLVRSPPPTAADLMAEIVTAFDHDAPPSVERNAASLPFRLSNGTITVPPGCTSGCPPRPLSLPAVASGLLPVAAPATGGVQVSGGPWAELSNSM